MDFNTVWTRILKHQGEVFYTVTNKELTYHVIDNAVLTNRTNYPINKSQFIKAYEIGDLQGPGQISNLVRGSSYVFAILTDSRIRY